MGSKFTQFSTLMPNLSPDRVVYGVNLCILDHLPRGVTDLGGRFTRTLLIPILFLWIFFFSSAAVRTQGKRPTPPRPSALPRYSGNFPRPKTSPRKEERGPPPYAHGCPPKGDMKRITTRTNTLPPSLSAPPIDLPRAQHRNVPRAMRR